MTKRITRVRWSASGLPNGVLFDEITGTFSGTPKETGQFSVPVTVETNYKKASERVTVNVINPYWETHGLLYDGNLTENAFLGRMYYGEYDENSGEQLIFPLQQYQLTNSTYGKYYIVNPSVDMSEKSDFNPRVGDIFIELFDSGGYVSRNEVGKATVVDWCYNSSENKLYHVKQSPSSVCLYYGIGGNSNQFLKMSAGHFCSLCYSPSLNILLAFTSKGKVVKREDGKYVMNGKNYTVHNIATEYTGISTGMSSINPHCSAWSSNAEVFCVAGSSGVAISSDGETWTTYTSTDIPKNLVDLEYRKDLGRFFARGGNDNLCYTSQDGITWECVSNTPIPLSTVARLAYGKECNLYCAVGGTGKYAYFSRDLENWVASQISSNELVANDIIYYPPSKCWIFTPTTGEYFYTKKLNDIGI